MGGMKGSEEGEGGEVGKVRNRANEIVQLQSQLILAPN